MFDADKTRMIGLQCGEEIITMSSSFRRIPERDRKTDRQKDGRTDKIAISISHVSMLTLNKNRVIGLCRLF